MVSEKIKIDIYNDYYEMDIEFTFYNFGDDIELTVGFPEYTYGTGNVTNIRNFRTSINNENVNFETAANSNISSRFDFGYIRINSWYVKNVFFGSNKYTISRVRYRADYANHGFSKAVVYLYGTGSTWRDNIDNISIEIINHTDYWLNSTFFNSEYTLSRKNNETIEIHLNNVSPKIADTFSIDFSNMPAFMDPLFGVSDYYWRLNREIIPNSELELLNSQQLRILRNSIYAYHGYEFRSADLQNYFNSQGWYRINRNFSENSFSANERTNLDNIIREENRRN